MGRRALLIALTVLAAAGCQVAQRIPVIVVGPFDEAPSVATFQRILVRVRAAGYEPELADPRLGIFRVRARYVSRLGEHGFVVQCYADGLVEVSPIGPAVEQVQDGFVLPPSLRNELVLFSQRLADARRAPP